MKRLLAGIFDSSGRADSARLNDVFAPSNATVVQRGPLRVAFSGPACPSREPLCLFDGFLDNAADVACALGRPDVAGPEELIACAYRRWGGDLLRRLRGDFALLVWDSEQGEGLIARDQLGVRSMFLHEGPGGLCFAGEIGHLLALLPARPAPDPEGVASWIVARGRRGSGTLYAGIRRLDPGAVLLLGRGATRQHRYWTPRFVGPLDVSGPELDGIVRESIGRAVQRRLSAGGITGVLMSGGLDSSSVAAVAAAQAPGRVAACSAVFPEHPAVDESQLIDELRGVLALPGITAEVRPGGLVASAAATAARWQIPLASWGDFWAAPLLRAAATAGIETVLGGDGGDELFGARVWLLADRLRAGHPHQALGLARELPGAGDRPPRRIVARVMRDFALAGVLPYRLHDALHRPLARHAIPPWMRPHIARALVACDDPHAWKRLDGPRWWAGAAHALTREFEEAGVFEAYRHRSAAAGLEARHPLFDLDLLELGLRQPPLTTFDRHRDRPVLRSAMNGLLPDSVRLRAGKALFDSVLVDSFVGPDRAAMHELLCSPRAELGAYVDLDGVRRALLADGAASMGSFAWMQQLWRLVTIECWLRAQNDPHAHPLDGATMAGPASVTLHAVPA